MSGESSQRERIDYTAERASMCATGFNPDVPIEGYYRFHMVSGGIAVAVRLWFGAPIEPWTGEEMDRAPRWNATVNGQWVEVERVWPMCAEDPIDEDKAAELTDLQQWGAEHGHADLANPRRRLSPLSTPMMF